VARGFKKVERDANDRALHHWIIRLATGIAERKVREHETRHAALLDYVARGADDDRRNSVGLEVPGNQTHGLMTDRSERHQQRNVDIVSATKIQNRRRIFLARPSLAEVRRHAVKA
jgi:hypothetical protein